MDMSLSELWEIVKDRGPGVLQSMGLHGHDWATERQEVKSPGTMKFGPETLKPPSSPSPALSWARAEEGAGVRAWSLFCKMKEGH